jgi:hypothetical protein
MCVQITQLDQSYFISTKYLSIPKKKKKRERILEFSVDIVMDLFWFSRNQVIHNSIKFDIGNLLKDK